MKELSIEEKAKRYDEAIEKAKSKIKDDKDHVLYEDDIIDLFPELKIEESEDKRMIQYFKDLAPFDKADVLYEKYGFSHKDAIAWLEQQCEQKVEPKSYASETMNEKGDFDDGFTRMMEKEQKLAEWREEDEQLYNDLSDTYFYNDEDYPEETYKLMLKRVLDWMTKRAKSLRPQSQWKPSDEMLEALYRVIPENVMEKSENEILLDKLYQGLKYGRVLSKE